MNPSIRVGVFDWSHFPSASEFYPSDLPPDWRLSYYANEFESACFHLLPGIQHSPALRAGFDDLPTDFELSFYLQSGLSVELLAGIISRSDIKVRYLLSDATDSDILSAMQSCQQVLCSAGIKVQQGIIDVSSLWQPNAGVNQLSTIALLPGEASMRQYREWIEQWLDRVGQATDMTLWLQGKTTSYRTLADCRALVELMGF